MPSPVPLIQGSPTLPTLPHSWPVRNWAVQQEVSGGEVNEASSVFTPMNILIAHVTA